MRKELTLLIFELRFLQGKIDIRSEYKGFMSKIDIQWWIRSRFYVSIWSHLDGQVSLVSSLHFISAVGWSMLMSKKYVRRNLLFQGNVIVSVNLLWKFLSDISDWITTLIELSSKHCLLWSKFPFPWRRKIYNLKFKHKIQNHNEYSDNFSFRNF